MMPPKGIPYIEIMVSEGSWSNSLQNYENNGSSLKGGHL
jgi:hypothetical protein